MIHPCAGRVVLVHVNFDNVVAAGILDFIRLDENVRCAQDFLLFCVIDLFAWHYIFIVAQGFYFDEYYGFAALRVSVPRYDIDFAGIGAVVDRNNIVSVVAQISASVKFPKQPRFIVHDKSLFSDQ